MANVCWVPLSYIFMRGQGVKIFSLVSKQCLEDGFVIPTKRYVPPQSFGEGVDEADGYEGAIVLEPETENISHDTIVLDKEKYGSLLGHVVYGDTDSLFVVFPSPDNASHRDRLATSIRAGQDVSREIHQHLKKPHNLEYEKTLFPLILLSKKRTCLRPVSFLRDRLRELAAGRTPLEELVISKTLKSHYKFPAQIAHAGLPLRMYEARLALRRRLMTGSYVFRETTKRNSLMSAQSTVALCGRTLRKCASTGSVTSEPLNEALHATACHRSRTDPGYTYPLGAGPALVALGRRALSESLCEERRRSQARSAEHLRS
eukprot:gene26648-biopygen3073